MEVALPLILLVVLGGFGALVARSVRRRKDFLHAVPAADQELPDLQTELTLDVTLRRLWRDSHQGLPLAEVALGERKLVFCPVDHATHAERYKAAVGKPISLALFGLATLAPGGVEAIRDQIRDADKLTLAPDLTTLIHQGQLDNDYVVLCRVLSQRDDHWGELPLRVYRAHVLPGNALTLELAVPQDGTSPTLSDTTLAHGSARLFGYLK